VSAVAIRRVLVAVCLGGIAGMIVTSIADSPGGALTFGLLTAAAALGMILVTAVTNGGSALEDDELGQLVEERIALLVADGADERAVRALVRDARKLGGRS
jgi:multisubunit Na+/H+ antiporter MnhB subunit